MKAIKYKCLNPDCGHQFVGDLSTTECPECGSQELKTVRPGIPKWVWLILAGIVLIILLVILLKKSPQAEGKITAKLSDRVETLEISVKGIESRSLAKYYVVAQNGEDSRKYPFIGKGNNVFISKSHLTHGTTYEFRFIESATKKTPKNFKWEGLNTYYYPPLPVAPKIDTVLYRDPDYKTQSYGQVEVVLREDSTQKGLEYYLDDEKQPSAVFKGVPVGVHEIIVKNDNALSDTFNIELHKIIKPKDKVTIDKINEYLNEVHKGTLDATEAYNLIMQGAKGELRLKSVVGNCKTFFEVLRETRGSKEFKAIECKYDDNNNIKQGTLLIKEIK